MMFSSLWKTDFKPFHGSVQDSRQIQTQEAHLWKVSQAAYSQAATSYMNRRGCPLKGSVSTVNRDTEVTTNGEGRLDINCGQCAHSLQERLQANVQCLEKDQGEKMSIYGILARHLVVVL